jgi:hypothetical protein
MDIVKIADQLNKTFKLKTSSWGKKHYSPTSQFLLVGRFNKEKIESMIKVGKEFTKEIGS